MAFVRVPCRRAALAVAATVTLVTSAIADAGASMIGPAMVAFSGYSWGVKASTEPAGPGPNLFSDSPENVWADAAGQLHLRITARNGVWRAAEVVLDHSLGYGTYRFTIASPVGRLDPNVVLGLFTWSDDPAYNHREIDIEVARWGDAARANNAQYVVQPYDHAGNIRTFVQPDAPATTQEFTWAPNRVSFRTATAAGTTIASWKYSGPDVPRAGDERARVNLWLDGGAAPSDGVEVEVVLSRFSFTRR